MTSMEKNKILQERLEEVLDQMEMMGIEVADRNREIIVDKCNQLRMLLEEYSRLQSQIVKEKLKTVRVEEKAK